MREEYREFGAQCCDTLGEACAANPSIVAVDLASASECSSPSPFPIDPKAENWFFEGSERMNVAHKNNCFKIWSFQQNLWKLDPTEEFGSWTDQRRLFDSGFLCCKKKDNR